MSETSTPKTVSVPFMRLPFGCSFFLLDLIAFVYIITHWGEVSRQIGHLIALIP